MKRENTADLEVSRRVVRIEPVLVHQHVERSCTQINNIINSGVSKLVPGIEKKVKKTLLLSM